LTCPKKYILFTEEGAEEHCQYGVLALSNQCLFDWLDDIVWDGKKRVRLKTIKEDAGRYGGTPSLHLVDI
jgi:hypothetical protein